MRRPLAALAFAAALVVALAPAASATPREDSFPGFLSAFLARFLPEGWTESAGRSALDAEMLSAGTCIDPLGQSAPPAPSCPLPPPAPAAVGVDEPEL